jgi:hypothetical protein
MPMSRTSRIMPRRATEQPKKVTKGPATTSVAGPFAAFFGDALRIRTTHSTTPVRSAFFTSPMARVMSMSRGQASTQL